MAARLYIAGTGSYAAQMVSWVLAADRSPAGLIEMQDESRVGSVIHGLPVIGRADPPPDSEALIGIGGDRAETWATLRDAGWAPSPAIAHPDASIARSASLGEGVAVGPRAVVDAHASVSAQAVVSRGALIGHHVTVGEAVMIGPGVNIGGNSELGAGAFLGIGCVISNGITIGARALVAAGAVVIRDVPAGVRVQGVPARKHE